MHDESKPNDEMDAAEPQASEGEASSAEGQPTSQAPINDPSKSRRTALKTIGGLSVVALLFLGRIVIRGLGRADRNGFFDGPKIEPPSLNLSEGSVETFFSGDSRLTLSWNLQGAAKLDQVLSFPFSVVARTADGKRKVGELDPFDLMDGQSVRQSGTLKIDLHEDWHNPGSGGIAVPTMPSHPTFGPRSGIGHARFPRSGQQSEPEMIEVTIVHSLTSGHPVPVSNMIKVPVTNEGRFSPESDIQMPSQINPFNP